MIAYIKNNIPTPIELNKELDSTAYNIGSTFLDYEDGKWVAFSNELYEFYKDNPNSSIKDIWDMSSSPEVNIELLRNEKIAEIDSYDKSINVNGFYLNGMEVWIDKATRVGLMNSTLIHIDKGISETDIWFEGFSFTLPCYMVIQMLQDLEMYAYECFNVTAKHKSEVMKLSSEDEINNYDITSGYPEKLQFNV